MKRALGTFLMAAALPAMILLPSCATFNQPPDPAKVRAQIAEYRQQEIELVRDTVSDPARAEQLLQLLAERDALVEKHARRVIEHRQEIAALTADYDARREDFETLLAGFNRDRASAQKETIDLVTAMKAATTADEWKVISRFQLKRLNPRELVYGTAAGGS